MRRSFFAGLFACAWFCVATVACGGDQPSSRDTAGAPPVPTETPTDASVAAFEDASAIHERALAIVLIDVAGDHLCSGTLIAPRLVVTADSCVRNDAPVDTSLGDSSQQTVALVRTAPDDLAIFIGDDVVSARLAAYGTHLLVPRFRQPSSGVAIVVLDEALTTVTPLVTRMTPPNTGDTVWTGAFGRPRGDDPAGTKRIRGDLRVVRVSPTDIVVDAGSSLAVAGAPVLDATTFALLGVASSDPRGGADQAARFARIGPHASLIEAAIAHVARLDRSAVGSAAQRGVATKHRKGLHGAAAKADSR